MRSPRGSAFRYRVRLAVIRRRRLVAVGLLAAAVAAGLQAVRPAPPPSTTVLVAARDLPAGHRLTSGDLAAGSWYPDDVPAGTVPRPAGRVLSSAIRRGELLTDTRVLGDGLLTGLPAGTVAVAVRLADPASALVVRPGERADVLAGPADDALTTGPPIDPLEPQAAEAGVVVTGALVLSDPAAAPVEGADAVADSGMLGSLGAGSAGPAPSTGAGAGVLLVAVTRADAVRLAGLAGRRPLTVALHERLST
jgi:pilus assembly protein CpaB